MRVTSVSTRCVAATSVGLLACDFDGKGWVLDALAYLDAAAAIGVPVALERSRSGEGAHTWTFFSGPVPAATARRLGVHILREAMEAPSRVRPVELRPSVPHPGLRPQGILWEPDRPSAPGRVPATREHRLSRPGQPRALRGPVGVPGVDPSHVSRGCGCAGEVAGAGRCRPR